MNDKQKSGGGFFNGFLWGAVLGAGVVFLVGTKRGKKLLNTLTQEGLEGVSELSDVMDDLSNDKDYEESVSDAEVQPEKENSSSNGSGFKNNTRRFFKRK